MSSVSDRLMRICRAGGCLTNVFGPPGCGKTTLLEQALRRHVQSASEALGKKTRKGLDKAGRRRRVGGRGGGKSAAHDDSESVISCDSDDLPDSSLDDGDSSSIASSSFPATNRQIAGRKRPRSASDDSEQFAGGSEDRGTLPLIISLRSVGFSHEWSGLRRCVLVDMAAILDAARSSRSFLPSPLLRAREDEEEEEGESGAAASMRPTRINVGLVMAAAARAVAPLPLHVVVDDCDLLPLEALDDINDWRRVARFPNNVWVWCVSQKALVLSNSAAVVAVPRCRPEAVVSKWLPSLASASVAAAAASPAPDSSGVPPSKAAAFAQAALRYFVTNKPMKDCIATADCGRLLDALGGMDRVVLFLWRRTGNGTRSPNAVDFAALWGETIRKGGSTAAADRGSAATANAGAFMPDTGANDAVVSVDNGNSSASIAALPFPARLLLVAAFYCGVAPPAADQHVFGSASSKRRIGRGRTAGQKRMASDGALLPTAHKVHLMRLQAIYRHLRQIVGAAAAHLAPEQQQNQQQQQAAALKAFARMQQPADPATGDDALQRLRALASVATAQPELLGSLRVCGAAAADRVVELVDIDATAACDFLGLLETARWLVPTIAAAHHHLGVGSPPPPVHYTCHIPTAVAEEAATSLGIDLFQLLPQGGRI